MYIHIIFYNFQSIGFKIGNCINSTVNTATFLLNANAMTSQFYTSSKVKYGAKHVDLENYINNFQ